MYISYHDYQTNRAVLCEADKKAFSYSRLTWVPEPDDYDHLGQKLIKMLIDDGGATGDDDRQYGDGDDTNVDIFCWYF